MQELTIIQYTDWTKSAIYGHNAPIDNWISIVRHVIVDDKEVEELRQTTYDNVQKILSNYI